MITCFTWSSEERIKILETGVIDVCETPCGCSEWNKGPTHKQQLFLTSDQYLLYLFNLK